MNPSGLPTTSVDPTAAAEIRAIAGQFIQAVIRRDLETASQFYEPSIRPVAWGDILPTEEVSGVPSDFSECVNAQPVVQDISDSETVHGVIFRFPSECAMVPTPSQADQNVMIFQRYNGLGVRLQKRDGQWWVTGFGAFRAFS